MRWELRLFDGSRRFGLRLRLGAFALLVRRCLPFEFGERLRRILAAPAAGARAMKRLGDVARVHTAQRFEQRFQFCEQGGGLLAGDHRARPARSVLYRTRARWRRSLPIALPKPLPEAPD
jgi:hypothetical protein